MAAVADIPTATAAPPTDPVTVAVQDRHLTQKLIAQARCILGSHRAEAEDAVQTVFERAYERRGDFDPARGSIRAWLGQFLAYVCLEIGRKSRKPPPRAATPVPATEAGRELDLDDVRATNRRFLERLPAEQKRVVELRELQELTYDEIAVRMRITIPNARQLHSRGMGRMRELAALEGRS